MAFFSVNGVFGEWSYALILDEDIFTFILDELDDSWDIDLSVVTESRLKQIRQFAEGSNEEI
jgi:hypothetical protein